MTLIATVTVDSIDENATEDGSVVVRAIASGSDAISTNTEGEVSKIEIHLHCPQAPGLKVGDTLTLSTHFVKSDPNAPTTPTNAVGPDAADPDDSDASASADPTVSTVTPPAGETDTAGAADADPASGGPGSANTDASVPAEVAPVDDTTAGEVPAETEVSAEANAGPPDAPELGQVDSPVPADAGAGAVDPVSPEGGTDVPADPDTTTADETTEVPPTS